LKEKAKIKGKVMRVDCHVDMKNVRKWLHAVGEDKVPGATVNALNRAAQMTQTSIRRKLASQLGIKQKQVKRRVRFGRRDKAKKGKYESGVFLVISQLPVSYLGSIRQTKAGARVKGKLYSKAFKATMPSGHTGVFLPKNPADKRWRRPIREVKEPIDARMLGIAQNEAEQVGAKVFQQRFVHELKRMMGVQ
jgi:hypothetical protein